MKTLSAFFVSTLILLAAPSLLPTPVAAAEKQLDGDRFAVSSSGQKKK
jgi:hypothetical protein